MYPWSDTFALWALTRSPLMLRLLHPFALAIATSYATLATEAGCVIGTRYPFRGVLLPSATAQLARALLVLGQDLGLVNRMVDRLLESQLPDGGWGDGGDSDPMATFAAAELLTSIEPGFDSAAAERMIAFQHGDGRFQLLGPDAPWFTREVVTWLEHTERPYAERFVWPHADRGARDGKTGLPHFAWFVALAELLASRPGLAQVELELAFIDLAGFRDFNTAHGQDMGDEVLVQFASLLADLDHARAIRDGGDEFLVVGAPTLHTLEGRLDELRHAWPGLFAEHFGSVAPVAPRIALLRLRAGALREGRDILGRAIGPLKKRSPAPSAVGVLFRVAGAI
jgi:GGDEF domain-containing protein